ncbi:MAG: winged helix-turn-helix domain-containing protein [Solirubrobacteraceae bacterium]
MTFLEAAEEVLRSVKRPMSAQEIAEIALRRGLIKSHGKTPEQTMSARLYGASADGPIQREYQRGRARAVRGSVRWVYVDGSR